MSGVEFLRTGSLSSHAQRKSNLRVIPYSPRMRLVPYHLRYEKRAVLVAHRRFGKTVGMINDIGAKALNNKRKFPEPRYAYIAPYLAQAKENVWGYIKHYLAEAIVDSNESDLWVQLVNGAKIRLHGADNPNRLRGAYLDGVVNDEYQDWKPGVFDEVVQPMLADFDGWATFAGTPRGRNAFYKLYDAASRDPEWFTDLIKASESGVLSEKKLAKFRRDMSEDAYAQEFECSFDAASVGTYFAKDLAEVEAAGRVRHIEPVRGQPVNTVWDLGMNDSMVIIWFQVVGDQVWVLDCYENSGYGFDHYAAICRSKGYEPGVDYFPHDARVRELESGRARIQTLQRLGFKPDKVPNAKFQDGINAARISLRDAWFDEAKTQLLREALKLYRQGVDKQTKMLTGEPVHDWTSHYADAWRYLSLVWHAKPEPEQPKPGKDMSRPALAQVTVDELLAMRRKVKEERV